MKIKYILISIILLVNIVYGLENKFIDPRNNDGKIVDIGYENAQGNSYLSKGWQKVLSELKQVPNIREFRSRNLTREELCITDGMGDDVCPYNWQECQAQYEHHDGFSKETSITRNEMKVEKESSTPNGKMQATYALTVTDGWISHSKWEADVLRGTLRQHKSGQELYDEGFKSSDGKFAMKVFNFGSGCGGLTIYPLPDRLRTLKNGGSSVSLKGYSNPCNQTISSRDAKWATVYMEWDNIPSTISWRLDDYGYISEPSRILGFVERKCPDNYIEVNGNPDQCQHTYSYYTYSCPDGLIGDEDDLFKYSEWTKPLISTGGDCGGNIANGSSCNSPVPPVNNCKRNKYTCPINGDIACVQTSGETEKKFKRLVDSGESVKHEKELIDSKKQITIIEQVDKLIETKIEWSDKITSNKKIYSSPDGANGEKWFCINNTTWNDTLQKCEATATVDYVDTEVPDYSTWEGGSGGNWSVLDNGSTLYQSINGHPTKKVTPTVYGYGTFEGVIRHSSADSDDDYMGFVLGYQNENDYYLLSWGTGWSNSKKGLYLVEVKNGDKDFWNYTGPGMNVLGSSNISWANNTDHKIKVELSSTNMKVYVDGIKRIDVNGNFHAGKFGYYNYSLAKVSYKGFKGSDLQTITCPSEGMTVEKEDEIYKCYGGPSTNGDLETSSTSIAQCSNGGDWNNDCMKCPIETWTPPSNCIDCVDTIVYDVNSSKTGTSDACVYEYQVRECPAQFNEDHGTDISGNTCNESNQNNYESNCDDCSRTITTMTCPADAEFPSETYPEISDPENWFLNEDSPSECQRTTYDYICEDEDYQIIDGLCTKKYSYFEYKCKNEEWIGPNISGEDCLATCEGFGCLCNSELPPEDNCYQDIPLLSGDEPVVSRPAKKFETSETLNSGFNESEYGLSKGYTCVDSNGENCGYDVFKIEGEENKLCFYDKFFYKECIDVQGCTFEGKLEIDKKDSFSALTIEPNENKIFAYVKDTKIDGEINSSCVINGKVGKIGKLGGFNSVKMDKGRMSFWNSYTAPENSTPKSCQKGKYDPITDQCLPDGGSSTYNAHITYEVKPEQPEQSNQSYSYGTKVKFEEDINGKAKVLVSANYIGYCPVGTMSGYLCVDSQNAVRNYFYDSDDSSSQRYKCNTPGFNPETQSLVQSGSIRCIKNVEAKSSIGNDDWFIKDFQVPLNGSVVNKNGINFNINENRLIVSPDNSKHNLYNFIYTIEREPKFSCNEGDVQINEYTCQTGGLLEGESHLIDIKLFDNSRNEIESLNHTYSGELYHNFTSTDNVLSSVDGNINFRLINGNIEANGSINISDKYKIIGNKSELEYYQYLSNGKSEFVGSHELEWNGSEIQTIGGSIQKNGYFKFSASDIDFNLYSNEIKVSVEHSGGSRFNGIIQFYSESNKYCPVGKTPSFNGCIDENIELGFFEFVPSCAEVQEKYSEYFYEGFRERNLLYDFDSIVKFKDYTYARSSYKMTEQECQEFADDANWQIASVNNSGICDDGWYEDGDVCKKESDSNEWTNIIDEIYNGNLNPEDLFVTNVEGLTLEFIQGDDLITGEKGLFIYTSPTLTANHPAAHMEGFHFKPSFEYNGVETSYKMQGADEGYRCQQPQWIPLNGPGYEGGSTVYYQSPCINGYTCIQGSNVVGQDTPISASYRNDNIDSSNTLLTWSGSNYNNGITSGDCARSEHIPDDRAGTFLTKLMVKGYSKIETKPKNLNAIEEQKRFFEEYIPEGSYLDIYGSNGETGEEPSARFEYSCNGLYTKNSNMESGVYPIRFSKTETVPTYCDISNSQGWMLAGKIDGSKTTFLYDNPIWTNDSLLNGNDTSLSKQEMKNKIWTTKKFTKMKLVFNTNGDERTLVIPISGKSLKDVFISSDFASANVSRSDWKNVIANSSLQYNCNQNGVNISVATGKVRIGIISNQEANCQSPDSFIGIGSNRSLAPGGHDVTAGNWAGNYSSDNGAKNHKSFVYIYVSDTEDSFEREYGTNQAYCIIQHEGDRTFSGMPMCTQLTGVEDDRKFYCSAVTCNNDKTCQLARCEEGTDGMEDFMGVKQVPDFDFTDICSDQECDANKDYTNMCGRDTGCEEGNGSIIKKDGNCYEQYCTEGDLVYDTPRNKCKVYNCPEGTVEQDDGRCLVP